MGDVERLTVRRPDGSDVVWDVEMDPGLPEETKRFRTRRGSYRDYRLAIRYAIGGDPAEFALENAIAVGLRMLRRFDADQQLPWELPVARYPWELSQLLGYNVDCAEPFSVTVEYGTPLDSLTGPLSSPDDLRAFITSLARGLFLLDRLGVVHRQLRDNTVHWDSRSRMVQINRFEYARQVPAERARLSQIRTEQERTPRDWESPEQITGGGSLDPRDDLYSAGCAVLRVATGGLRLGPDRRPEVGASGNQWLARLLAGVFEPVDGRPDAAELLRRIGHEVSPDHLPRPDNDHLAEGRGAYDRLTAARRALVHRPRDDPEPPRWTGGDSAPRRDPPTPSGGPSAAGARPSAASGQPRSDSHPPPRPPQPYRQTKRRGR
ncbi:hypothetical protein [Frankia sp. AgB32]|uniref:hypothetical protein n=1 Tax=Frankia sp. AgB32 TaxID=631119 RepID=UPI00200D7725|nr:hypothetical protein [Frankia sp. AgB32]MCK9896903.1 hypothetical protein [Frankia sp. AgB32]